MRLNRSRSLFSYLVGTIYAIGYSKSVANSSRILYRKFKVDAFKQNLHILIDISKTNQSVQVSSKYRKN